MKLPSKLAQRFWRRMKVCGSYAWTCKGGWDAAAQSSAPLFHCAGKEPCTGSDVADATHASTIASDNSELVDAEWKTSRMRENMVASVGCSQQFIWIHYSTLGQGAQHYLIILIKGSFSIRLFNSWRERKAAIYRIISGL
jgi:hypothetical protein